MQSMERFRHIIWSYFRLHKRVMPWRDISDPYGIFISEIMLQQTQVARVLEAYPRFLSRFPTFRTLADAPLKAVLSQWQGMGYNRRARYLKEAASVISDTYHGILPESPLLLDALPGIGEATAASMVVFAYDKPVVFIETNIRKVFIHHFFRDGEEISDKQLYPLVQKALDVKQPRQWYYALMDYGAYLGKIVPNPNRKSKIYSIQSSFEGSDRQVRGAIIRLLLKEELSLDKLIKNLKLDRDRAKRVLEGLVNEKMIQLHNGKYSIV